MNSPEVCIVLATYNGAAYLDCQLESIQKQTFQNWELLIRDDGSTDTTTTIIDRYCSNDPRIKRITHINPENEGPQDNFRQLLVHALTSPASLFMFCDQDDCWYPKKVQTYLDRSSEISGPCLIYSDFELVDSKLRPLDTPYSFETTLNSANNATLAGLLSLNHIPGCCIAINRKLAEIASPIPDMAIMHDWWLALTAAACGKLSYIDEKLIKYRQHSENAVGVTSLKPLMLNFREWHGLWRKGTKELCQTMQQANELAIRLQKEKTQNPELLRMLFQYAEMTATGPYARLKTANQLGLRKDRGILRFVLYLRLLRFNCGPKSN